MNFVASNPADQATAAIDLNQLPVQFGRYLLQRYLGAGGMGLVFLAEHTSLHQRVALKTIKPGQFDLEDQRAVTRFYREIEAAGAVLHGNVARATDAGEECGIHFLVTEFIDGPDLCELVRNAGPLSPGAACSLMEQVCNGLQGIHEQHLVHRDIKPSNVLVTWDGDVKIVDLGLARFAQGHSHLDHLTKSCAILGTLDFLAPEQAQSAKHADIRADLYSAGCTLIWLLTGKPLFGPPAHSSAAEKIYGHCHDTPDFSAIVDTSPQLVPLLERLLAKSPEDRFKLPADAAEAFREFADPQALLDILSTARPNTKPLDSIEMDATTDTRRIVQKPTDALADKHTQGRREPVAWFPFGRFPVTWFISLGVILVVVVGWGMSAFLSRQTDLPEPVGKADAIVATDLPENVPPRNIPRLDELPLNQWHDLLQAKPRQVFWNTGLNFTAPFYNPKSQQLAASCDFGMLEFGSTQAENYKFQVAISQQRWHGGVGIYFGAHRVIHEGHAAIQYQGLMFCEEEPAGNGFFTVQRQQRIEMLDQPVKILGFVEPVAADVLNGLTGEQVVEITVVNGSLQQVRINAVVLRDLTNGDAGAVFQPPDHAGGFGALIDISGATYKDARFMAAEEN